jgi:hypothetical protein
VARTRKRKREKKNPSKLRARLPRRKPRIAQTKNKANISEALSGSSFSNDSQVTSGLGLRGS